MVRPNHYRLSENQAFLRFLLHTKNNSQRKAAILQAKPREIRALQELIFNFGNWVTNHRGIFPLPPKQVQQLKNLSQKLCNRNLTPKNVKDKILKEPAVNHRFSNLQKIGLLLDVQKNYAPSFLHLK